jgi:hypothetical protein
MSSRYTSGEGDKAGSASLGLTLGAGGGRALLELLDVRSAARLACASRALREASLAAVRSAGEQQYWLWRLEREAGVPREAFLAQGVVELARHGEAPRLPFAEPTHERLPCSPAPATPAPGYRFRSSVERCEGDAQQGLASVLRTLSALELPRERFGPLFWRTVHRAGMAWRELEAASPGLLAEGYCATWPVFLTDARLLANTSDRRVDSTHSRSLLFVPPETSKLDDEVALAAYAVGIFHRSQRHERRCLGPLRCQCTGVFGNFRAYDMASRVFFCGWLPHTGAFAHVGPFVHGGPAKVFRVDRASGRVTVRSQFGPLTIEPGRAPPSEHDARFELVDWLDALAARLRSGYLRVAKPPAAPQLLLWPSSPELGPRFSIAVTRGVRVIGAAVQMLASAGEPNMPQWSYSFRLALAGPGEPGYLSAQERGFETCQLVSRRWLIEGGRGGPERVEGAGVVGHFPVLALDEAGRACHALGQPGNMASAVGPMVLGEFEYASCCGRQDDPPLTLSGELEFAPGAIRARTGPTFSVRVAPIVMPQAGDERFLF